ncbi:MAG: hypothetical protein Kow0090_20040 [Myxococcota bacterium]
MRKLIIFAMLFLLFPMFACNEGEKEKEAGGDKEKNDDIGADDDDDDNNDNDNDSGVFEWLPCEDPINADLALDRPNIQGKNGEYILPDGRKITPYGTLIKTRVFPMASALSPDGNYLAVSNSGDADHYISLIDLKKRKLASEILMPALYVGLAFNKEGELFAAGGQSDKVYRLKIEDGSLKVTREYTVEGFPSALAFSPDEKNLYVILSSKHILRVIDLETGASLQKMETSHKFPYDVVVTSEGENIFWSNWGQADKNTPPYVHWSNKEYTDVKPIAVGKNPTELLLSPDEKRLYVSCGDADRIDVIDVEERKLIESILLDDGSPNLNISPTGMALSPDGKRLYVAAAVTNAVYVIDLETKKIIGAIPTSWYGVDVKLSRDGAELYWTASKGEGSGANADNEYIGEMMMGTVGIVEIPSDEELAANLKVVEENFARPTEFFQKGYGVDCKPPGNVLSQNPDYPSPIKHVVLVIKENRTYDQVFGGLEFGNGDSDYLLFGEDVTPNQHKLAREFVLMDNFYTESEISIQGHVWTTMTASNDFTERTWQSTYRDDARAPASGVWPSTIPEAGIFLHHVINYGLTPRSYGQIVGYGSDPIGLKPYINLDYGFFNMDTKDVSKIQYVIKDIADGIFPDFIYISLPNDHTYGSRVGKPTAKSMVADNDEALGMLVEAISNSPYWEETLIFVTEDDPQAGADHVDAHRTLALLISPWVKRSYLSSVHYSFASFFRTAEIILGIPPLSRYDANAAPFYDCFADELDTTPYEKIPRLIKEELNMVGDPGSWESEEFIFDIPDQNPDMGIVLWKAVKGENAPTPKEIKQLRKDRLSRLGT